MKNEREFFLFLLRLFPSRRRLAAFEREGCVLFLLSLLFSLTSGRDCRERISCASSTPGKCCERTCDEKENCFVCILRC